MNKSFVRGGQLSLHSLRMLKQVFVVLVKLSMFTFVIINVIYLYVKVSLYQVKTLYWYFIASFQIEIGNPSFLLEIHSPSHSTHKMTASNIVSSMHFIKTKLYFVESLSQGAFLSLGVIACLLCILSLFFLIRGGSFAKDKQIRGATTVSQKQLRADIASYNKKKRYNAYLLGGVEYPANSETTHTMIAGTTGSGKTVLISDLISQIKERGDRAIIFDKMGIYTERFYDHETDTLLNPFDARSPSWSIFNEVNQEANFDSIALAFIPHEKSGTDPFWAQSARTIFSEVCGALFRKGGVNNEELVNTLLKKNLVEAAALVKGTAAGALLDEQSPKTALSVMSMLSTHLKCLEFLRDDKPIFSIKDWINDDDGDGCIFMTSTGTLHASLTPLISAWLDIAISNILSLNRSQDRKIWFILDELPSLHSLPSLEQGLAETRQFGGCFVLSIQSISQLKDRYGINGSQTISSLCNNKIFLRAGDHDSAKWYSDSIGISEVEEYREGLSYGAHQMRDGVSINHHKHARPLVLATELTILNDMEGYFLMAKSFPVAKVSFKYVEWKLKNERLIPHDIAQPQVDLEECQEEPLDTLDENDLLKI